jgi:hypothetical protein
LLKHLPYSSRIFDPDALVYDFDLDLPSFDAADALSFDFYDAFVGILD